MPWEEIPKNAIIFDPEVQTYCNNPKYRCPFYGHSWGCPPEAPYLEDEIMKYEKFYLIYIKLNLNDESRKDNRKGYNYNEMRERMEREMDKFFILHQNKFNEIRILWDGHCRICEKENEKCSINNGSPCRYPDKIRYSMEAVGIEVSQTVKNVNIDIEWPPVNHVYRFGLVCTR